MVYVVTQRKPDFDVRCYFSAKNVSGQPTYPSAPKWYRPWELANDNFGTSPSQYDTVPAPYQWPDNGCFENGLRLNIDTIQITDTLDQGSWMHMTMTQCHDRNCFEVADNEHFTNNIHDGRMLPRFAFPCRPYDLTLYGHPTPQKISGTMTFTESSVTVQGVSGTAFTTELIAGDQIRADANPYIWHTIASITDADTLVLEDVYSGSTVTGGTGSKGNTPAYFAGMLSQVDILPVSDEAVSGVKDGVFRIALEFDSFENFFLKHDVGAGLWYHRRTNTTDGYHWAFTTQDNITFDAILSLVINSWMNEGRPTTNFPVTYRYTAVGSGIWNTSIRKMVPKALTGTLAFTNASAAVVGTGTVFTSELSVGLAIGYGASPSTWYIVASIEDDTHLTLASNYSGGSPDSGASAFNLNWVAVVECKDRPTWDIVRDVLIYAGGMEGQLKKYIPKLSFDPDTGYADITAIEGGFDKTHAVEEDFSQEVVMNNHASTAIPFAFNRINVPFSAEFSAEYWIKFTLYHTNHSGSVIATIPATGYEYVEYDPKNKHSSRSFTVPTQESGTYEYVTEIVGGISGGSSLTAASGGKAYSPPLYTFPVTPTTHKYKDIKTFAITQGRCSMLGVYTAANIGGCKDGGIVSDGVDHTNTTNECPDQQACYPDPEMLDANAITGTLTFTASSATVTGTSTLFTTELAVGNFIRAEQGSVWWEVQAIATNTSLTITAVFSDPCFAGNVTGNGVKKSGSVEAVDPVYGLRGISTIYAETSNQKTSETLCRRNSKRLHACYINSNSSIRIPAEIKLDFEMGWTARVVGKYIDVHNIILNELVRFRCIEQVHTLKGNLLSTSLKLYRV